MGWLSARSFWQCYTSAVGKCLKVISLGILLARVDNPQDGLGIALHLYSGFEPATFRFSDSVSVCNTCWGQGGGDGKWGLYSNINISII